MVTLEKPPTVLEYQGMKTFFKPPLKWAGGKRWLVPYLRPLWERHKDRRLVEPFCGGLAVTLGLFPKKALLNDINFHAINFYKWLKKGLKILLAMQNRRNTFDLHRNWFNKLVKAGQSHTREAAELFYFLNRTGYNGLCRFNQSGEFNVPFGQYKNINYVKDFTDYRPVFRNWDFITADFEEVSLEPSDFVYADPPYDVEFTQYSKEGFDWEDQVRLVKFLAGHPGPVALSNQATERIVKLYRDFGFELKFLDAPRRISCNGNREKAREVLAIKGF